MKLGFSQQEIKGTLAELNLPEHSYYMRRAARALDIVNQDKVHFLGEDVYRVDSQYDDKHYLTELNHGNVGCTCEDFKKNGVACKHMIAATIYKKERQAKALTIYDDTANSYLGRGRWIVTDHKARIKYIIYRDKDGRLHCPCNRNDCEHKKAIRDYLNNNGGGNGSKIMNECGTEHAQELQSKLNAQLDSQGNNGNGDAKSPSQPMQLDISNPFQESEQNDVDQIEGRKNGELAWQLSNGEYVISYKGIMTLADKHNIEFSVSMNDDTNTIIAKASNGNERVSGKEVKIYKYATTASELAKRNAARQLLPLTEIKAVEHKAKLNADFDWQQAKAKCLELVNDANLDIIIWDLTQAGKLRQDNPSHYDRTEWLIIHEACEKDAQVERDPKSVNNWSYNSAEFIDRCKQAIETVRESKKQVEANEQPLQHEGNRKLQMDSKLRTFLIETDGTKKAISCREICLDYDGKIVSQLRAGIDSGADISTVELD